MSLSENIANPISEPIYIDNTNIYNYRKTLSKADAYFFPRVKDVMEISFSVSMCYCPSFESPLDSDQTPCNSGFEFIQEIGAMRFWHYLLCDLTNY